MNYRTLGRTGLSVSEVGLGTWAIGGPARLGGRDFGWGKSDDKSAVKGIEIAVDAGVNFIDTADIYGYGKSEALIGKALSDKRDRMIIATKAGNRGDDENWIKDFSPKWIKYACEQSLKRLKTDYIDLYQLHTPHVETELTDEIIQPFIDLKKEGKIRFYGISLANPEQGIDYIKKGYGDVVQTYYNIINREAEKELLPLCEEENIGVIGKTPLASGFLTGKYNKNTVFEENDVRKELYPRELYFSLIDRRDLLTKYTNDLGITYSQLALAFCLKNASLSTVIPGVRSAGQVLENIRASSEVILSDDVENAIREEIESFDH